MTSLMNIPAQEFETWAELLAAGLGNKKKFIFVKANETIAGALSFHYFDGVNLINLSGAPGRAVVAIPPGGLTNQVLAKASDLDFDVYWRTIEQDATNNLLVNNDGALLIRDGVRLKLF